MTTDVALIAIFGATGTGKTTFVNDASGGNLQVGHKSHACTQDVSRSPTFQLDGRKVVLFDTPGFDDTHLSDTEILKRIAGFLTASYKESYKLTGIIYLHRITDIRVGGISRRTFKVFRKLCGKDSLSNVLIVTNMWSDPPTPQQIEREVELESHPDFFQPALAEGATTVRHTHMNTESAHSIIRHLLKKSPTVMTVQRELVEENKSLSDTGAGREVEHDLIVAAERHKAEMIDLKTDLEEAMRERDERAQKELAEWQTKAEADEKKRQAELRSLKKGYDEEQARWQKYAEEARAEQKASAARQKAIQEELEAAKRREREAAENNRKQAEKRAEEQAQWRKRMDEAAAEQRAAARRQQEIMGELEAAKQREKRASDNSVEEMRQRAQQQAWWQRQVEEARAEQKAAAERSRRMQEAFQMEKERQESEAERAQEHAQQQIASLRWRLRQHGDDAEGCIIG